MDKRIFQKPRWVALFIWSVALAVVLVMIAANPVRRSVTPTFHKAVQHWFERGDLYAGFDYHYPPHFAVLFAPFHLLPVPAGDMLWRVVCAAALVTGLRRLCGAIDAERAETLFLWGTLLAVPLSLSALRNGQANALLAGLFAHAIAALIQKRWWSAVLVLLLSLGIKQFAIVFPLLAVFIYRPLIWRFVPGLAVFAVFPFLFANPTYVLTEYRESIQHLNACANVTQNRFADIAGIVRAFGSEIPPHVSQGIRLSAGALALVAWLGWGRRLAEPVRGLWLYALATAYLMLFNPMTEANSYVIIAPAMASWAIYALHCQQARKLGGSLIGMILAMGLLPTLFHPFLGNRFSLVFYPLGAAFLVWAAGYLVSRVSSEKVAESGSKTATTSPRETALVH